jgi:hypothetical protein
MVVYHRSYELANYLFFPVALITSLLGLIVFPYQEIKESKYTDFRNYKLEDLYANGWPKWKLGEGVPCDNLEELIRHVRNAASHRRIIFSSDSRQLCHVDLLFYDRKNPKGPDDWDATINAAELRDFILLFARFLKKWQKDYS